MRPFTLVQVKVTCVYLIFYINFWYLDFCGPWGLPALTSSVLSSCARLWRWLHDRCWKHTRDNLQEWDISWGTALSHGVLLGPSPHIPEVCFQVAISFANWNSPRHHPWPRFNPPPMKKPLLSGSPWVNLLHSFFLWVSCVTEKNNHRLHVVFFSSSLVLTCSFRILCKPAAGMLCLLHYAVRIVGIFVFGLCVIK